MCIIFIAKNINSNTPLLIAANRDEYYARPTLSPHWWEDAPHLFAGKDLQAGGTWLGHNQQHRIAGITNLRRLDWHKAKAKSRGDLVKRFLDIDSDNTDLAIDEFTEFLSENHAQYNPFNLLFGDSQRMVIFSSATGCSEEVADGVHGISNGALGEAWPKVKRGIERYSNAINKAQKPDAEAMLSLLNDSQLARREELPDTGLSDEEESMLSSIFIPEVSLRGQPYGTRSSSVIWTSHEEEGLKTRMKTNIIM